MLFRRDVIGVGIVKGYLKILPSVRGPWPSKVLCHLKYPLFLLWFLQISLTFLLACILWKILELTVSSFFGFHEQ